MISKIFVDRPRLAIVIAIVMTIAGAISLLQIPLAQFPDIVPPQVEVKARYPGASAEVVEATVGQLLESKVVGVDNMIYMKSTSGNDGSYTLLVSFALGTDPDQNTVNVNNRVQLANAQLPKEVQQQGLSVKKKSSAMLQVIALSSTSGAQDPLFISNYATINILDEIKRIPGVGDATMLGPLDYSMRIWFETDKLTGLGLTPSDIVDAISKQNRVAPVGRIGAQPIGDALVPAQHPDAGAARRHGGVRQHHHPCQRGRVGAARARRGAARAGCRHPRHRDTDQREAVDPDRAIPRAGRERGRAWPRQSSTRWISSGRSFPEGLQDQIVYDTTVFVELTIHEVIKTLDEAFVLVVIVVFLFLGSFRATIIPVIAVPVSLIATFAVLLSMGYSANTISLLGMVLAIGIVVDDAIVVVEAVEATMEEHPELTPAQATKKAMDGITAPIIAITLVLLSVFVPLAFIPGISGTLFRQFAVVISVSMLFSAINALTLSPGALRRHAEGASRAEARHHGLCLARHRQGARRLRRPGRAARPRARCSASCCWA